MSDSVDICEPILLVRCGAVRCGAVLLHLNLHGRATSIPAIRTDQSPSCVCVGVCVGVGVGVWVCECPLL
jgi:hypothetical protein